MNERKNQDFERMLQTSFDELPPEDIVQDVTPWRKAMNRALMGLALTTLHFNFFGLNYVLPFIGYILSLVGFRALRRENVWFKSCWVIISIRTCYWYFWFLTSTTIYSKELENNAIFSAVAVANMILLFILFFCLWRGFKAVKRKAGLPEKAGSAVALLIWSLWLGVMSYSGWLAWVVIVLYICIIISLFKLSKELDEAGYVIQSAPVKISDRVLVTGILVVLAAGAACGYLFFNRYPMEWSEQEISQNAELEEIKNDLIALGFPEDILADLLEEDIRACKDAQYVVVEVRDHALNNGREAIMEEGLHVSVDTIYDAKELRITGIGVLLPGEEEQWKLFHHFQYVADTEFYGTESIQIWPAYRYNMEDWGAEGEMSGQVLYDYESQTYTAPYYSLESETYTSIGNILGNGMSTDVFATFSMPKDGENQRGYISYGTKRMQDGTSYIVSWVNYTHQQSWMQFPVITAKEQRLAASSGRGNKGPFHTAQDALQIRSSKEGVKLFRED